jgi:hypothetical protein
VETHWKSVGDAAASDVLLVSMGIFYGSDMDSFVADTDDLISYLQTSGYPGRFIKACCCHIIARLCYSALTHSSFPSFLALPGTVVFREASPGHYSHVIADEIAHGWIPRPPLGSCARLDNVRGASGLVTFICILCTLRTQISRSICNSVFAR